MSDKKPLLYVSLFSIFWAFHIIYSRHVLSTGLKPILLQSGSLLISSILLLLYYFIFIRKKVVFLKTNELVCTLTSGVLGAGLAGWIGLQGLQLSTSINYSFLIKTTTVFTVLFSLPILKEPIGREKTFYIVALMIGVYLMSTSGSLLVPHSGDILTILSAAFIAVSSVMLRVVAKRKVNSEYITMIRTLSGAAVIVLIAYFYTSKVVDLDYVIPTIITSLLQVAVLTMWARTLSVSSASYATMMSMATPVLVTLIAIPIFNEAISMVQIAGGSLIIYAGVMTQVKGIANHH